MNKTSAPMLRIAMSFLTGILLHQQIGELSLRLTGPFLLLALVLLCISKFTLNRWVEIMLGIAMLITVVFTGSLSYHFQLNPPANHISNFTDCNIQFSGTLISDPKATRRAAKVWVRVDSFYHKQVIPVEGALVMYFRDQGPCPNKFDRIKGSLQLNSLNVKHAGYRNYLMNKGITHSAFCRSFEVIGQERSFMYFFESARNSIAEQFNQFSSDPETTDLSIAMLLGDKSGLDRSQKSAFSRAGLSHILAISGLHVGLIFGFLNSMLAFIGGRRVSRNIRIVLTIIILIAYGLITGASPAVCRAIFMFSVLLIGQMISRSASSLNSLSLSALILLVIDPNLLFDIGFQLSYSAVFGILTAAPPLERFLKSKWSFLPFKSEQMMSITLCAQLFTAPLIAYHFGTFPTYFLLSNLLILPIATLAVRWGFVTVMFCFIPWINWIMVKGLNLMLSLVYWLTNLIAELPGAVIEDLSIDDPGCTNLLWMGLGFTLLLFAKDVVQIVQRINLKNSFTLRKLKSNAART